MFDKREYDVTCCLERLCCGYSTLVLEPEEAELTKVDLCSRQQKRLPYGELGDVDHGVSCGCCHSFQSNLAVTADAGNRGVAPGCGCSGDLVEEIVEQLKSRMRQRGDTGNIQRAEQALRMMAHHSLKMDALLRYWALPAAAAVEKQEPAMFDKKDYDVTSICHRLCCCGAQMLELDPEEAVLETTTCCSDSKSRRPYGQLLEVEVGNCCGICVSVSSSMGPLSPGCGCDKETVDEIVQELKTRMKARGDTGNIRRQEEINQLIMFQDARLKEVCQKIGVKVSDPLAQPPVVQMMS